MRDRHEERENFDSHDSGYNGTLSEKIESDRQDYAEKIWAHLVVSCENNAENPSCPPDDSHDTV